MPSVSYLQGQAKLLLKWAADTKDSEQAVRLRTRARQLFILAEASEETDKHLSYALGEFNAQQMGLHKHVQPVRQQQQQQQRPEPTKPEE